MPPCVSRSEWPSTARGNIFVADTNNNVVRRIDAATGIITTYAGGGTPNDIGDGGPATAAQLGGPIGVAVDRGALYITESAYNANRVRRVDMATGIITTVAGTTDGSRGGFAGDGGPARNAILNNPVGMAIDPAGNLYVVDNGNERIRRIDVNGNISTYAGGGAAGSFADGIRPRPRTLARRWQLHSITTGTCCSALPAASGVSTRRPA